MLKKDFLAIKKVARAFILNKDIEKNKILNQDDFDLRRTNSKKILFISIKFYQK